MRSAAVGRGTACSRGGVGGAVDWWWGWEAGGGCARLEADLVASGRVLLTLPQLHPGDPHHKERQRKGESESKQQGGRMENTGNLQING